MGKYQEYFDRSLKDPDGFWGEAAQGITWSRKWDNVLDDSKAPFYRWFVGGELNTCFNAVDRHVQAGKGGQTAIIYDSPVTGVIQKITYDELLAQVRQCAGALRDMGVAKGDTVIIYLPMVSPRPW
jgi:propionyl-CoA synthetase